MSDTSKKPMTPEDAKRIQSAEDVQGKNDHKPRAMAAADKNVKEGRVPATKQG